MLYHILIAVLSITTLCVLWIAVQRLARKQAPHLSDDADVLACTLCSPDNPCRCGLKRPVSMPEHKEYIDEISNVTDP